MTEYFKADMAKLSYSEAWRWGGFARVITIAILKLTGVKRYGPQLIPATPAIMRLDPVAIPKDDRHVIDSALKDLSLLGFEVLWYYTNPKLKGPVKKGGAVALHSSGNAMSIIMPETDRSSTHAVIAVSTRLISGKYLTTNNAHYTFDPPNEYSVMRLHGRSTTDVVRAHMKRIQETQIQPFSKSEIEQQILENQRIILEHNVKRGLYVPA